MNQILRQQQIQAASQPWQGQLGQPYQNQMSTRGSGEGKQVAAGGRARGPWHNEYQSSFPREAQRQQQLNGELSESDELQNSLSLRVFQGEGRTIAESSSQLPLDDADDSENNVELHHEINETCFFQNDRTLNEKAFENTRSHEALFQSSKGCTQLLDGA